MKEYFKVEGLKELEAALKGMSKATSTNVMRRTLLAAGEPVARDAASLAPDDPATTGYDLRRSITVTTRLSRRQRQKNKKESKVEVYIGAGPLVQAHQQEFGNVHHGPQPFLRPAWDSNKMGVLSTIKTLMWDEIEKVRKRMAAKAARLLKKRS